MAKLADVFFSIIQEIDQTLKTKESDKRAQLRKDYLKSIPKMKVKQATLQKLLDQIKIIDAQIEQVNTDLSNLDPKLTQE